MITLTNTWHRLKSRFAGSPGAGTPKFLLGFPATNPTHPGRWKLAFASRIFCLHPSGKLPKYYIYARLRVLLEFSKNELGDFLQCFKNTLAGHSYRLNHRLPLYNKLLLKFVDGENIR